MTEARLVELVRQWIRAEYEFRLGSRAYTKQAEEWLLRSEQRLRRAVTGERELLDAYEVVNDTVDGDQELPGA